MESLSLAAEFVEEDFLVESNQVFEEKAGDCADESAGAELCTYGTVPSGSSDEAYVEPGKTHDGLPEYPRISDRWTTSI